jgi:hypothetical protein
VFGCQAIGGKPIPNVEAHSEENTLVERTKRGLVRRVDAGKRVIPRRGRGIFDLLEQHIAVELHPLGTLTAPSLSPVPSSRVFASNTSWVRFLVWNLDRLNAPGNSYCNLVAPEALTNKSTA